MFLSLPKHPLTAKRPVTHDSEKSHIPEIFHLFHEAHLLWAGLQQVSTVRPAQQKLYRVTADIIYISRPKVSMGFKLMEMS